MNIKKKQRIRNIIWLIVDIIVISLVVYFVLGYLNFSQIKKDKEPLFEFEKPVTYKLQDSDTIITVNDYKIYRIVKVQTETPRKGISYGMKLWFMKDTD